MLAQSEAAADAVRLMDALEPRHRELLVLLCKGMTQQEAADAMGISKATAYTYCQCIRRTLEAATLVEAAVIATRSGSV